VAEVARLHGVNANQVFVCRPERICGAAAATLGDLLSRYFYRHCGEGRDAVMIPITNHNRFYYSGAGLARESDLSLLFRLYTATNPAAPAAEIL